MEGVLLSVVVKESCMVHANRKQKIPKQFGLIRLILILDPLRKFIPSFMLHLLLDFQKTKAFAEQGEVMIAAGGQA
jgi:hypothetical protein